MEKNQTVSFYAGPVTEKEKNAVISYLSKKFSSFRFEKAPSQDGSSVIVHSESNLSQVVVGAIFSSACSFVDGMRFQSPSVMLAKIDPQRNHTLADCPKAKAKRNDIIESSPPSSGRGTLLGIPAPANKHKFLSVGYYSVKNISE